MNLERKDVNWRVKLKMGCYGLNQDLPRESMVEAGLGRNVKAEEWSVWQFASSHDSSTLQTSRTVSNSVRSEAGWAVQIDTQPFEEQTLR